MSVINWILQFIVLQTFWKIDQTVMSFGWKFHVGIWEPARSLKGHLDFVNISVIVPLWILLIPIINYVIVIFFLSSFFYCILALPPNYISRVSTLAPFQIKSSPRSYCGRRRCPTKPFWNPNTDKTWHLCEEVINNWVYIWSKIITYASFSSSFIVEISRALFNTHIPSSSFYDPLLWWFIYLTFLFLLY